MGPATKRQFLVELLQQGSFRWWLGLLKRCLNGWGWMALDAWIWYDLTQDMVRMMYIMAKLWWSDERSNWFELMYSQIMMVRWLMKHVATTQDHDSKIKPCFYVPFTFDPHSPSHMAGWELPMAPMAWILLQLPGFRSCSAKQASSLESRKAALRTSVLWNQEWGSLLPRKACRCCTLWVLLQQRITCRLLWVIWNDVIYKYYSIPINLIQSDSHLDQDYQWNPDFG